MSTVVLKISLMLIVMTLKIVSLLKTTLLEIITLIKMTLITVKISLVLILENLVVTGIEIPLVLKTFVHSILILIFIKIVVPVLGILILSLVKTWWSKVVIGTIAQEVSVPLLLVRITPVL